MSESNFKKFLHDTFEKHSNRCGQWVEWFVVGLIGVSIIIFIGLHISDMKAYHPWLFLIDRLVLVLFAGEYFIRFWVAKNKRRFVFQFLNIVDLIVILPIFSTIFTPVTFLRVFRLLEIFRVLKLVRYSELMNSFLSSFRFYRQEIKIFGLTAGVGLLISSFSIFLLEQETNPQINNLGDAFWWATVTMSTVGYGDITPVTIPGKILAAFVIILGLGIIAVMTAILTKIFMDHFFGKRLHACYFCRFPRHDFDAKYCKNCGNLLDSDIKGSF